MATTRILKEDSDKLLQESGFYILRDLNYLPVEATDVITVTDEVIIFGGKQFSVADTVTVIDSVDIVLITPWTISIAETITVNEDINIAILTPWAIFAYDQVAVSDAVEIVITPHYLSVTDIVSVTDSSEIWIPNWAMPLVIKGAKMKSFENQYPLPMEDKTIR